MLHGTIKTSKPRRGIAVIAGVAISTLALSACGAKEYPGEFTVANGDSEFYVGNGPHRHDTVTVRCSEKGGTITATLTESNTGNSFTTTQPEEGAGLAGGTLTMGDSGDEYVWNVRDGATAEDEHPFEDDMQSGDPVTWTDNASFTFGSGVRQATTKSDDGEVRVQTPGEVVCSGSA